MVKIFQFENLQSIEKYDVFNTFLLKMERKAFLLCNGYNIENNTKYAADGKNLNCCQLPYNHFWESRNMTELCWY